MYAELLLRWLFPYIPAVFRSDFPIPESVARLRACTQRKFVRSRPTESAIGSVSESRVKLYRVRIVYNDFVFANSFRPVFYGVFAEENGQVLLRGQFTLYFVTKIFTTIWFLGVAAWVGLASYGAVRAFFGGGDPMFLVLPLAGAAFGAAGFWFVKGGWWLSRDDIPYLTTLIEQALRIRSS